MGRAFVCAPIVICLGAAALMAQAQAPRFEVASVRLLGETKFVPDRMTMTSARVDLTTSLWGLIRTAYRVQDDQLSASVDLKQVYVNVQGTMPSGATVAQIPEMLQRLLAERCGLAVHRESRPMDAYELVTAPGGVKMLEVQPVDDLKREFPTDPSRTTTDTTAETPMGLVRTISIPRGQRIITSRTMYERTVTASEGLLVNATRMSMTEFVSVLQGNIKTLPIVDETGLSGVYQFTVELPNDADASVLASATAAFRATQGGTRATDVDRQRGVPVKALEGLGLKLERRRVPIDVVVVDKILRTPTEN